MKVVIAAVFKEMQQRHCIQQPVTHGSSMHQALTVCVLIVIAEETMVIFIMLFL